MRRILGQRWLWITVLFAAINAAGLIAILHRMDRERRSLAVESFEPQGEVGLGSPMWVRFTEAMVSLREVGPLSEPDRIQFTPPAAGRWVWADTRTLGFQPDEPLKLATPYTVRISHLIASAQGRSLARDALFAFQTTPLRLEDARQTGFSPDRRVTLALDFNDKVVPEDVLRHLVLSAGPGKADVGPVSFTLASRVPSRTVTLTTRPFRGDELVACLQQGLRGLSGPLGLAADVTRRVEVETGLSIGGVDVHMRDSQRHVIAVHCTQAIDLKAAPKFIEIEPKVDFTVRNSCDGLISDRYSYGEIELSGPFEPAKHYRLKFLAGLKGRDGSFLAKDVLRSVWIPDLAPALHFKSPGIYLSAEGSLQLPLEAVNVPEAEVAVERVYENNVVHYLREFDGYRPLADLARQVGKDVLTFKAGRNKPQVVDFDLKSLLADQRRGVFFVSAHDKRTPWVAAQKLVLITDLGISVRRSESDLLVWVNKLSTATPVADASISVFTRTNQKVFGAKTDASGIAHIKGVEATGERAPFVVCASQGEDTAFVELAKAELDHSPFDIGGRPYLRRGYEAFLYSDQGIYRPGGKAILHAIVRGADAAVPAVGATHGVAQGEAMPRPYSAGQGAGASVPAVGATHGVAQGEAMPRPYSVGQGAGAAVPKDFPVQFHIVRPDGRPFKTVLSKLTEWGSAEIEVALPQHALTGPYRVGLKLPQGRSDIGELSFLVEEFLPDRMKVELAAESRRFAGNEGIELKVKATHLFGAPAAERDVEARCELAASEFAPEGWKGYRFTDSSRKFAPVRLSLGKDALDENGETTLHVEVPAGLTPPSALTAVIKATVKEVGGRGVTASLSRAVDVYRQYVGLARKSTAYAEPRKEERIACVVVQPDGQRVGKADLAGGVYRIVWNSVLKVDDEGRYRYVSEREEERVAQLTCSVANGEGEVAFAPPEVGEYEVRLQDKAGGASASLSFVCAGQGFVPWAMEKPDRLELAADKPVYAPGETARILIKAPFAGQALVTVESDRIHLARTVALEANTQEITLPVEASWGPNVYCSATVIRRVAPAAKWAPHRAYGVIPILLDSKPHQIQVKLDAPQEVRPGKPLTVNLQVSDAKGQGARAEVTLAAVDEGICQLTRFATPNPWSFFYAKRGLAVTAHDVYSLLMPETEKKRVGADSAPGGDSGREYDPRLLNPVSVARVRPVALWKSGVVTGEDGRATVTFEVPEFSGQLRLMAVAANAQDYGSSAQATLVKQPLLVQASFPRFLSPGDEFAVPVTVFNNTGRSGNVALACDSTGGIQFLSNAPPSVNVENGREGTVLVSAKAPLVPGPATMTISARLGDERATTQVELAVRPPATLRTVPGSGVVEAGKSVRFTLPADWVPKTDRYTLSFSSLPTLQLGHGLSYLLHYPYGCIEQTTSCSFPLLYLGDVASATDPDAFRKEEIETYVQAGIERLMSMQTHGGGFSYWPGYTDLYPWGSCYATHFLVEAKKAGYAVPKDSLDAALDYLDRSLVATGRDEGGREVKAYACFVLAQAGRPNGSWTYRLAEEAEKLPAYSRSHVVGALAAMKEQKRAATLLQGQTLPPMTSARDTGGLLHSSVREAAILLSVYLDVEPSHPNVPLLVKRLEESAKNGYWASTQENAFALLALGKYSRLLQSQPPDYQAEVLANGERLASFTHRESPTLRRGDLGGREVEVRVSGKGSLYYTWRADGIPLKDEAPERDTGGLKVRRKFLSRDGKELQPGRIPHGELVVVELSIQNDRPMDNVVVNDLLPAGFEIENPRIATSEAAEEDGNDGAEADHGGQADNEDDAGNVRTPVPPPRPRRAAAEGFAPDRVEMRDDRLVLFANLRQTGTHEYRYVARAVTRGRFQLPALSAFCMYDPAIASTHGAGKVEIVGERAGKPANDE